MSIITHADKDALIVQLRQRITELYAELREEARLNGMGAEREAKLLARIAELEAALLDAFYAMQAGDMVKDSTWSLFMRLHQARGDA